MKAWIYLDIEPDLIRRMQRRIDNQRIPKHLRDDVEIMFHTLMAEMPGSNDNPHASEFPSAPV